MKFTRVQVPVPGVPISLLLSRNGTLALIAGYGPNFKGLYEQRDGQEVLADFYPDCVRFTTQAGGIEELPYGVSIPYKQQPLLKQWLIQQKLELNIPEGT